MCPSYNLLLAVAKKELFTIIVFLIGVEIQFYNVYKISSMFVSLSLPFTTSPLLIQLLPHWLHVELLNIADEPLPQSICMGYSLYLKFSSSEIHITLSLDCFRPLLKWDMLHKSSTILFITYLSKY
jgi:hypothetical protein